MIQHNFWTISILFFNEQCDFVSYKKDKTYDNNQQKNQVTILEFSGFLI